MTSGPVQRPVRPYRGPESLAFGQGAGESRELTLGEMWACPQCHSVNAANSRSCYSCRHQRPATIEELHAVGATPVSPVSTASGGATAPGETRSAPAPIPPVRVESLVTGARATWARMPGKAKIATVASALIIVGFIGVTFSPNNFWAQLAILAGMVLLIPAILLRPREGSDMAGPGPRWGLCTFTDTEGRFCRLKLGHGGMHEADPGDVSLANGPAMLIRTYGSRSNNEAVRAFQSDTAMLARYRYEPTSQS